MCLAFFIEKHGFNSQPGETQEGSLGRKCPGGELLECYSKEYGVEGSTVAVWRALQVYEDEPTRPRVSVSSEGFVLEGHESDPKVYFTNDSLNCPHACLRGPSKRNWDMPPGQRHARAAGSHHFTAGGTVACVWHSSLKVMGLIPSLAQPKKAHQGGNAQVESYLNDPRKGAV